MAYSEGTVSITLPASTDLSASQYCFVAIDTSGEVALSGDNGNPVGILQNKPDAQGRAAEVLIQGVSKLVSSSATFRAGYNMGSAASGQGKETVSSSYRNGVIIESASAVGDIVSVLFQKNGLVA